MIAGAVAALGEMGCYVVAEDLLLCLHRCMRRLHMAAARAARAPAHSIGADALLPLLVWAVVHAPLPCGVATLAYVQRFCAHNAQQQARRAARERARWHLERTAAPDDRRLEDLHVAAAITSNQTADLAEGMIGFSVDDGNEWESPPSDDDVWTPVERGSE